MHSTHSLLPSHSALWGKRECALCIWASKIRPYQISTSYTLYTVETFTSQKFLKNQILFAFSEFSCYDRVVFSLRLKNSRAQKLKLKAKNSNSRIFSRKLKHFFRKNSRNRKILRALLPFIINLCSLCIRFCTKTPNYLDIAVETQRIFENLKETQGLFENSRPKQPKFFQKLKISETPLSNAAQKTAKKKP